MANNLQKVHGDTQAVFHMDTANGPIAGDAAPTGAVVNLIGPAFQFFGMDLGGDPAAQMNVGGAIEAVIQCAQQLSTVQLYQVQATTGVMSIALFPVGAWTAATLQAAIRVLGPAANGTVNGYDMSGATVTDLGFKLAAA
jgi:hypothetical protein